MTRIVGVADMAISNSADETLITYSLGSCIAVVIYDPVVR
ncbi:MAG TPA: chemotaxis protein CheD, partial [Syntrophobacteraceae bacterium]|nr:chemotaxis protein CheD [Syntrophobacteraceae bacterium]